jgi:hypothetical protein
MDLNCRHYIFALMAYAKENNMEHRILLVEYKDAPPHLCVETPDRYLDWSEKEGCHERSELRHKDEIVDIYFLSSEEALEKIGSVIW